MRGTQKRIRGIAIAIILLAVVLLATIAFAIAKSSQTGNDTGSDQDRLVATTVINAAQQLKTDFEMAMGNGVDPTTVIESDQAPITSLWSNGAQVASILAPANATTTATNWKWHGANHPIIITNVGTSAGNYLIELIDIRKSVCEQINLGLFGSKNIPTVATSGWDNNPGDLTNDPATAGVQEGCFFYGPSPEYFYYKVVLVR